jgi:hypothetical protein
MENLDIRTRQMMESLDQLNPQIHGFKAELEKIQTYLTVELGKTATQSKETIQESIQGASQLQELLMSLFRTALEGQSQMTSFHELSLRQVTKQADEELSGLAMAVAAAVASTSSLQNHMVRVTTHFVWYWC